MTDFIFYEAQRNSDQTEGRGGMVTFGRFRDLEPALEAVKGQGVMGVGDGEIVQVTFSVNSNGIVDEAREKVYGYHKDWTGKWGYGFVDNRDAPVHDPEYQEFLRLQKKFGGSR